MTDIEMKIICEQLIDKYKSKQVVVAIEELSELQKELCKALRDKPNKDNIIEEMADCIIMLNQMQLYFNISDEELHEQIVYKIKRTKNRLLNTGETREITKSELINQIIVLKPNCEQRKLWSCKKSELVKILEELIDRNDIAI